MCLIGLPPGHHRLPSRGSSGGHVGGPSTVAGLPLLPQHFPLFSRLLRRRPRAPQGAVRRKRATRNSKTKGNYSHGIIEQCHARQAVRLTYACSATAVAWVTIYLIVKSISIDDIGIAKKNFYSMCCFLRPAEGNDSFSFSIILPFTNLKFNQFCSDVAFQFDYHDEGQSLKIYYTY